MKKLFTLKKNCLEALFMCNLLLYLHALRGVAQPGRASALGAECRQFESGYPDTQRVAP